MYQFTEDCRIGIPEIDEEHKKLFQMVNEAFALLAEPSATVVGVKNLVLALKKYAATHFIHEEAYMDEIKDPELPRQKKEHEQFKEKVNEVDLEALNDENGKEVLTELLEFLSRWLYHHILGSDTMIGKMPALDEEEDPFAFTEKYKLGVELIDSEHQRLFEIIRETNELTNDVLFNDKYDDIKKIISELKDYTIKHFGDEEEPGTRTVGRHAETVLQIFVDGYQVHFVEQRYQQIGYDELSGNEAQHHLQIAEAAGGNHAGYGYIGHT